MAFDAVVLSLRTDLDFGAEPANQTFAEQNSLAILGQVRETAVDSSHKAFHVRESSEKQHVIRKSAAMRHTAFVSIHVAELADVAVKLRFDSKHRHRRC